MRTSDQTRPKTLLAAVNTFLQIWLYCRLPFSPRKNAHSSRHFLLRLIGSHAPAHHGRASCPPGACAQHTPVWHPLTAHGWKASPALSDLRTPGLFQFFAASAVVDNAIDHSVVIFQRHFRRAEGIVLFRLLREDSKSPCAVAHDEIFPIVRLMVNPISRRLHLFPRHIGHTKAASGCADPLLRRHLIRRGDRDLRCPFRLQNSGTWEKPKRSQ